MHDDLQEILEEPAKKTKAHFSIHSSDKEEGIVLQEGKEGDTGSMRICMPASDGKHVLALKCPDNNLAFIKDDYAKVCDYILLVYESDAKKLEEVIFCELKVTSNERVIGNARKQLTCTKPLLDYILSAVEVHRGIKYEYEASKIRYIMICEKSGSGLAKKRTGASQIEPEKYEDIIDVGNKKYTLFVFSNVTEVPLDAILAAS